MENVIFLNHKEKQCGVYQYGKRSADILKKSSVYNFIYAEVASEEEYFSVIHAYYPIAIIYNYHLATMPWISNNSLRIFPNISHYGLQHEGGVASSISFRHYLMVDSTHSIAPPNIFSIPRPLFENINVIYPTNTIPVISSFGFGFGNKGFRYLVKLVNDQFDEAIIRLHIPRSFYGDREGQSSATIFPGCYDEVKKPNIKLEITTNFLDDTEVLQFLANSNLNAFLYDEMPNRGLSSVIDYALSVNVPIATTKSCMFRHLKHTSPSICVENRTLPDIISSGTTPLQQYREKWSYANFIKAYEKIISTTRIKP